MKSMLLKSMLLLGIGVTASQALAFSVCPFLSGDRARCQANPACAWDDEDNRCESLNEPLICSRWDGNPFRCNAMFICHYDQAEGRCELF